MYLIKACPACKTKLRFPIDKGTIRVTCSCGHTFIANPDKTDIYDNASFDLSETKCGLKKMTPLRRAMDYIKFDQIIPALINKTLNIKYKIQNFRLLPGEEKRKIIVTMLIISAGIIGMVVTIYVLTHLSEFSGKIVV